MFGVDARQRQQDVRCGPRADMTLANTIQQVIWQIVDQGQPLVDPTRIPSYPSCNFSLG